MYTKTGSTKSQGIKKGEIIILKWPDFVAIFPPMGLTAPSLRPLAPEEVPSPFTNLREI